MRIITLIFLLTLLGCNNEPTKEKETTAPVATSQSKNQSATTPNVSKENTKTELAIFLTINADETHTTYYFKTLDGISLDFKVSLKGEPEVIVPRNLLEDIKYSTGHPGANGEMVGKVFKLIYDKDNFVSEVKLAE